MATVKEFQANVKDKLGEDGEKKFAEQLVEVLGEVETGKLRALTSFFNNWRSILDVSSNPEVLNQINALGLKPVAVTDSVDSDFEDVHPDQ